MGRRDCKWPCIFFAIFPGLVICSEEWQVWRCSHFVSEPQEAGAFHSGALECHYSVNNLNQLSSLAVERGSAERSPAVCPAQLRPVMKMNVEITSGTGMSWLSWLCKHTEPLVEAEKLLLITMRLKSSWLIVLRGWLAPLINSVSLNSYFLQHRNFLTVFGKKPALINS